MAKEVHSPKDILFGVGEDGMLYGSSLAGLVAGAGERLDAPPSSPGLLIAAGDLSAEILHEAGAEDEIPTVSGAHLLLQSAFSAMERLFDRVGTDPLFEADATGRASSDEKVIAADFTSIIGDASGSSPLGTPAFTLMATTFAEDALSGGSAQLTVRLHGIELVESLHGRSSLPAAMFTALHTTNVTEHVVEAGPENVSHTVLNEEDGALLSQPLEDALKESSPLALAAGAGVAAGDPPAADNKSMPGGSSPSTNAANSKGDPIQHDFGLAAPIHSEKGSLGAALAENASAAAHGSTIQIDPLTPEDGNSVSNGTLAHEAQIEAKPTGTSGKPDSDSGGIGSHEGTPAPPEPTPAQGGSEKLSLLPADDPVAPASASGAATPGATVSISGPGRHFWQERLHPVTADDNYATVKNIPVVLDASSGVLANDLSVEGLALTVARFDAVSTRGGSVAMNPNGGFTYTPPANFTGPDFFAYVATDGFNESSATVKTFVYGERPVLFESILADLPENEWARVNVNQYRDVWTPEAQRPGIGNPAWVIIPWSAAAWDSNRNEYLFWGGGHAAYDGNEVYKWSAVTLAWERASLPSQVVRLSNEWRETVDGPLHSPVSSHAFDNTQFLPIADRMITFGGAAAHTGGPFIDSNGRITGPYLWDPTKADPNKVGGLTGSHVNPAMFPDVVGGEMWENREAYGRGGGNAGWMIYGTTDYALIDGVETIFVNDRAQNLWTYTIPDVNDATQDSWQLVGTIWQRYNGGTAGAYDPERNIYVRMAPDTFTYWSLDNPGSSNRNVNFLPQDLTGGFVLDNKWGIDYDPLRERFVLWKGDGAVWHLQPPDTLSAGGWTVTKAPTPTLPVPTVPTQHPWTGVMGKWDYIDTYDVFIGVTNGFTGDVWVYKPEGWSPEGWMF